MLSGIRHPDSPGLAAVNAILVPGDLGREGRDVNGRIFSVTKSRVANNSLFGNELLFISLYEGALCVGDSKKLRECFQSISAEGPRCYFCVAHRY